MLKGQSDISYLAKINSSMPVYNSMEEFIMALEEFRQEYDKSHRLFLCNRNTKKTFDDKMIATGIFFIEDNSMENDVIIEITDPKLKRIFLEQIKSKKLPIL